MKTKIPYLLLCATLFLCTSKAFACYTYSFYESHPTINQSFGTISCSPYGCANNSTNVWFVNSGNERVRLEYTLSMPVHPGNRLRIWQTTEDQNCYQCMGSTYPGCLLLDTNLTGYGGYASGVLITDMGGCFVVQYDLFYAGINLSFSGLNINFSSGEMVESNLHVGGAITATELQVSGNVGIGTSHPMEKLHVMGNIIADTVKVDNVRTWNLFSFDGIGTWGNVGIGLYPDPVPKAPLHINKDGYDSIRVMTMNEGRSISTFPNVSVNQSVFFRRENSGGYPSDISVVYGYGYGLPSRRAGCINWYEQSGYSNTHRWGGGSDVNMTLSGNSLGIGVTPSANLHVRGGVLHTSGTVSTALFTSGTNVGTASSPVLFERSLYLRRTSNGSGWANVRLHDGIAPQSGTATPASTTRVWWERSPQDTLQSWGDKATAYMTLKGDKLGIGTTNPTEKLEVNGTVKATGLQISGTTGFENIYASGNVGIGTPNPDQRLVVNGTIKAENVTITEVGGADFVFAPDYNLPKLEEVEEHIKEHQHLPEIPSATEMEEKGVDMAELNMKFLQKIEELTLYLIEQNKRMEEQNKRIMILEKELKKK